jgi:hypothetical protein
MEGSPDEAEPFVSSDALRHPGLAGAQHERPAAAQIHRLQLIGVETPVGPVGSEL